MKRLTPVFAYLVFALILGACSSDNGGDDGGGGDNGGKSVEEYLPASNEITGWEEDTDSGEPGPEVTDNAQQAASWPGVNGAIDKFVETEGWVAVAREFSRMGRTESLSIYTSSKMLNAPNRPTTA